MKCILFLCTGNYYRSRLAEEYFNYLARKHKLNWRSDSRGINENVLSLGNVGPISKNTIDILMANNIKINKRQRYPMSLEISDLINCDRIIALSNTEHKSIFDVKYPKFKERIEYWNVEDIDIESPNSAWEKIKHQVDQMIMEIIK